LVELPLRVLTFETLPSTQDEMRRRVEAGEGVHGLVVRALEQTRGRGQRARDWCSGRGGSYQTLAVRDPAPPDLHSSLHRPHLALFMAVGLAQVFPTYGVQVGIKWPNDLLYRGKKLAGILTEYVRGHLLVGVGVNVHNEVPEGAAALRGWDLDGVHAVVLEGLTRGLALLEGDLPTLYAPFDLLLDQPVELDHAGARYAGLVRGVDAAGGLRLEMGGGVRAFSAGRLARYRLRTRPFGREGT